MIHALVQLLFPPARLPKGARNLHFKRVFRSAASPDSIFLEAPSNFLDVVIRRHAFNEIGLRWTADSNLGRITWPGSDPKI